MTQMELGITDPAQRRELLENLQLSGRNAATLALLLWQFYHLPNCFLSQDRLAKRAKAKSRKTIQRAIDQLCEMGIVATYRSYEPSANAVVNHYSIVWSEIALLVARQSHRTATVALIPEPTNGTSECPIALGPTVPTNGTSECPIALGEGESTNGTVTHDQWDSCDRPMGQLRMTNGTLGCKNSNENIGFQRNNREEELRTTTTELSELVVVVSFGVDVLGTESLPGIHQPSATTDCGVAPSPARPASQTTDQSQSVTPDSPIAMESINASSGPLTPCRSSIPWTSPEREHLVKVIASLGVDLAEPALSAAVARGETFDRINLMIQTYLELPTKDQQPAKLKNWLAEDWSFDAQCRQLDRRRKHHTPSAPANATSAAEFRQQRDRNRKEYSNEVPVTEQLRNYMNGAAS